MSLVGVAGPAPIVVPSDLLPPGSPKPAPAWGFTEEQVAELKARHRRIAQIYKAGIYQIIFRAPRRAEYKHFRSMAKEPARADAAQEALARKATVAVFWQGKAIVSEAAAREALDELLEEYPMALDSGAASQVLEGMMSGAVAEEEKG